LTSQRKNKRIRSLHQKKFRDNHGLFIIEGLRTVKEALSAKALIDFVLTTESFAIKNSGLFNSIKIETVSELEMRQLSPSATPPGILAICKIPVFNSPNMNKNFIYLDGISDPGNMGTILRTAVWFGVYQVALSKGCIDPYNPKVVRSAMGAHFYLSWLDQIELKELNDHFFFGADQRGQTIKEMNKKPGKWALAMGSEGHGLSDIVKSQLDQTIAIPKVGKGESLNVGIAMGILLQELTR
jgi:TrmH family RNA methyltransferase|tara:strand:+ start:209 stop:931 length:723 start_codon:yes stop_codon:yes gene_type:complete